MKIVVIGGTGRIGSQVVENLRAAGHEPLAASPGTGVDSVSGEGLAQALQGAKVVIDVSNSPSFADEPVLHFFRTSTQNLLNAARETGVVHYVALSIVGTHLMNDSGYMRAKNAQEALIVGGAIPYSIVRATQFFEFVTAIADISTRDGAVHLAPVQFQPIASADVARFVSDVALDEPLQGTIDIAGPDVFKLDELVARTLAARKDARKVVSDPSAAYSGAALKERSLVPQG
ncbi:MAG TPA: SDR family oxidoreductase, partial [Polyangiales bacterium]|nr:SDR family oxidoreductase [Polyangiales bacterium]